MMKKAPLILASISAFSAAGAGAQTKEPERAPPVASGFVLQPRMETQQSLTGAVLGAPGFLAGYRIGGLTLGLGVGVTTGSVGFQSSTDDFTASYAAYQITPTVYYDVWQSADGRVRFNLLVGVGYGRASLTARSGSDVEEGYMGFVPLRGAIGGDYFLHPNFALGGEGGVQSLVLASTQANGVDQGVTFNSNFLYGALRVTIVVGQ